LGGLGALRRILKLCDHRLDAGCVVSESQWGAERSAENGPGEIMTIVLAVALGQAGAHAVPEHDHRASRILGNGDIAQLLHVAEHVSPGGSAGLAQSINSGRRCGRAPARSWRDQPGTSAHWTARGRGSALVHARHAEPCALQNGVFTIGDTFGYWASVAAAGNAQLTFQVDLGVQQPGNGSPSPCREPSRCWCPRARPSGYSSGAGWGGPLAAGPTSCDDRPAWSAACCSSSSCSWPALRAGRSAGNMKALRSTYPRAP
jgi:hypothetical protein